MNHSANSTNKQVSKNQTKPQKAYSKKKNNIPTKTKLLETINHSSTVQVFGKGHHHASQQKCSHSSDSSVHAIKRRDAVGGGVRNNFLVSSLHLQGGSVASWN